MAIASLIERVLAAFDRRVHKLFRLPSSENPFTTGTYKYYWSEWVPCCAIVGQDGQVRYLGNAWAIRHHYDKNGVLQSRRPMPKWAELTDHVVYGPEADKAYWAQPGARSLEIGSGFEF